MSVAQATAPPLPAVRSAAVIDVGTTSIRMAIAEIDSAGGVRVLETLSQGVRLGKDTFSQREISRQTTEECVRVLKLYRQKLDELQITRPEQIRVVGTTAVREAINRLSFVDRVYVATGFTIEPIDEPEVHRLTYRSIQPLLRNEPRLMEVRTVITEVGGGSTELLIVDRGNVAFSQSYRLGSLRLRQALQALRPQQSKLRELMEAEVDRTMELIAENVPRDVPLEMIGLGGDLRFAARELLPHWDAATLGVIPVEDLARLVDEIVPMSDDELVRSFHLSYPDAETVGPALLTSLFLARLLQQKQILVSAANLREGMIREMADGGVWTVDFREQMIRSAMEVGRKCHFDEEHAVHTAKLATRLFQELQLEHGLDKRYELLLHLAALLHEIGLFVSNTSLHKHSMYLITHSDLFGLGHQETLLVALVARYHRRSTPKPVHPGYVTLDRERRIAVLKMAAMLRLAIALDGGRDQRLTNPTCVRQGNRLIINVPHIEDVSVEQLAMKSASPMFEEVFGLRVLLRTLDPATLNRPGL